MDAEVFTPITCLVPLPSDEPGVAAEPCGEPAIDYGRNMRDGSLAWAVCAKHDPEYRGTVVIDETRMPTWKAAMYVVIRDHLRYRLGTFGLPPLSDARLSTMAGGLVDHMGRFARPVVVAWLEGLADADRRAGR